MRPAEVTAIIIAKEPAPGMVKTRLCPPCSPEQAADIAAACLEDTVTALMASSAGRRVVVLEGRAGAWLPEGAEVLEQSGGGLGDRLAAAFRDVDSPAVLVGMDTPQLGAEGFDVAIEALCRDDVDAVLGPALDGGYWTIGLKRADPAVFAGVAMSRSDTAAQQLARLSELGLRVAGLHELGDVDQWVDAVRVAKTHPRLMLSAALDRMRDAAAS